MLDDFRNEEVSNSGEFLDEFRQRLNSQPLESVDERKATVNRSQQIFLSAILGVGLAGIVSWFIFSPEYSQVENVEVPVVRRPQTMIKVQPAEPGGMEILNQDKTVYDIAENNESSEELVENLLPLSEEPALPLLEEKVEDVTEKNIVERAEKVLQEGEKKQETVAEIKEEPKAEPVAEVKIDESTAKPVDKAEQKSKDDFAKEAKEESRKIAKTEEIKSGVWQVQLISSPNMSAVDRAWKDLQRKYSVLQALPHEVETADLGAKGLFYRLKVGAFVDRGDADKLCNTIKNSGGTCLVKKK